MILSHEELIELTGKKAKPAQVQALRYIGLEFRLRPDGSPIVLKSHVEKVFGGSQESKNDDPYYGIMPDFSKVA